jgi:hypothetical protein
VHLKIFLSDCFCIEIIFFTGRSKKIDTLKNAHKPVFVTLLGAFAFACASAAVASPAMRYLWNKSGNLNK